MLDTTTRKSHSTTTQQQAQPEQLVTEQIMQPFMGNRDWAQLIAPRTEANEAEERGVHAGEVASCADESWLPGAGYATTAFLSGLC